MIQIIDRDTSFCHKIKKRKCRKKGKALGKVTDLKEAIRSNVKSGMKLHLAGGIGGPSAAICEIVRQFFGQDPGFTLIQSTLAGYGLVLLHCNLVKKAIFSAAIDISLSARPSRVVQRAYKEKTIEFENWSLLSLQQRLMAGAMGLPFMPTRSLMGSDLAFDHKRSFLEILDPFGSGKNIGIVKALVPDISIVHGCASDADGNVILSAPFGDDIWGCLASTNGVIATVERIVPADVIKRHASLVRIPGYMVKAVSLVPFGLHPFSLANPGVEEVEAYETDAEFLRAMSDASKRRETLDSWIEEWILECSDHEGYLKKLGKSKLELLKKEPALAARSRLEVEERNYAREMLLAAALGREIVSSVRTSGHKLILTGAGSRIMPGVFLAYTLLKEDGYEVELMTGNGQLGFMPFAGMVNLSNEKTVRSSKMITDTVMAHGVFVAGKNSRCLAVIGSGQIDKFGNINSTLSSDGQFLVGSGGSNDAMNAREVIIVIDQSRDRFVDKLPYVTASGKNVSTVISTMGIFKKSVGEVELQLVACFPQDGLNLKERIEEIRYRCGWPLRVASTVAEIDRPSPKEMEILRMFLFP